STANFVLGATGTCSSSVKPAPAVNVVAFAVDSTPRIKSPLAVVVVGALASEALLPSASADVPSSDPDVATPAYSRIANRSVPPVSVSVTVTVFDPPALLSA